VKLSVEAPAKINRELRVGRLRPDGFHEVLSRMVSIDLADRISAEPAEELAFTCSDPAIPTGDDNLVVRAARLLAERAGVTPRARLHLEKRTPMGGGLGGGSADAGAALTLLAELWRVDAPTRASLAELAALLGSDVPFFLTGGEAEVSGRGEIVRSVPGSPPVRLLLLVPPFPVSTGAVYRAYAGRGRLPERLGVATPGRNVYLGPNDLASAVLEVEPRMKPYLASAAEAATEHAVSGSGSTIVLVDAPGARERLAARHPEARIFPCSTISADDYRLRTQPIQRGAP
jgi:4-diphosphocytidyl-2-C-methyl-D-erythritol kinase